METLGGALMYHDAVEKQEEKTLSDSIEPGQITCEEITRELFSLRQPIFLSCYKSQDLFHYVISVCN